jgi:hypothetical protein
MRHDTALAAVRDLVFVLSFFSLHLSGVVKAQVNEQNFFINPGLPGPNQAYSANTIWSIGSTQTIKWKTDYDNFTINLWQQELTLQGSGIGPGPTVFCKAHPSTPFKAYQLTNLESKIEFR